MVRGSRVFCALAVWASLVAVPRPCRAEAEAGPGPVYDLRLRIEAAGTITLFKKTRFYRSEDLHLQVQVVPQPSGWQARVLGLLTAGGEINYGIGEGPRKHQRYVLLDAVPSDEQRRAIEERILAEEERRGCAISGVGGGGAEGKKAFFNYYLWRTPPGSFAFQWEPSGRIASVENRVEIVELERQSGTKPNPRFFEILQFVLEAVPPFRAPGDPFDGGAIPETGAEWEVSCRSVLEGLVGFCEGVYDRRMQLEDPQGLEVQRARYVARQLPGTSLLRLSGIVDRPLRTPVRISGFRGEIWLESLERELYIDASSGRVLKDDLDLSFGLEREKNVLAISGTRNLVEISLVDRCFASCRNTDEGLLLAYRECGLLAGTAAPESQEGGAPSAVSVK